MYVDLITSYIYIYEIRNRRINTSGLFSEKNRK